MDDDEKMNNNDPHDDDDKNYPNNDGDINKRCSRSSDDDDNVSNYDEDDDSYNGEMHGGGGDVELDEFLEDVVDHRQEDSTKSYYSPTFNILEDYCLKIASAIKHHVEETYGDENTRKKLFPGSKVSVKDCCLKIRNITSQNNISKQTELAICLLLQEILPDNSNLPIHKSAKGSYISDIDNVLQVENLIRGDIDFDICPNKGCAVFVGHDERNFKCPSCQTNRYSNCKECTRSNKKIIDGDNKCDHSGRLAKKQLSYKCILPTIIKAILQPGFLKLINFKSYYYINGEDEDYICDIGNSIAYKEGLEEMKMKFHEIKSKRSIVNNVEINDQTIHVPLLFSILYDGVQLFKTKQNISHSPLFLTILNLPPIFRSIVGLG
jgi:hypothetical protein